jgi:hypothetical protein
VWRVIPTRLLTQEVRDYPTLSAWNPFTVGALRQFERANHLPLRGTVTNLPARLASALQTVRPSPWAWTWVAVHKAPGSGEYATLFRLSRQASAIMPVMTTIVNTGVMDATQSGTWPIYARMPVTTMVGTMSVPVSPESAHLDRQAHRNGSSWRSLGVSFQNGRMVSTIH